ncbi:hypothetical protein B0I35DRAFT_244465 [Stachybotrys elegans]|uniref:Ubiquitin-like protease family profile domain-containing protein n=1 Tax=Stachybotrys elegans TaxID=80388 RepID=A0A8K0SSR3_9HYPO|nr:hypothetical protein B0I35DRAFT_244465 [Stachybotrys elegans]
MGPTSYTMPSHQSRARRMGPRPFNNLHGSGNNDKRIRTPSKPSDDDPPAKRQKCEREKSPSLSIDSSQQLREAEGTPSKENRVFEGIASLKELSRHRSALKPRARRLYRDAGPKIDQVNADKPGQTRAEVVDVEIDAGSPDALSIIDPPLTRIVSDVVISKTSTVKRSTQLGSFKKPPMAVSYKPGDSSDDELQEDIGKRTGNFDGVSSRRALVRKPRGDIIPTKFGTPRNSDKAETNEQMLLCLEIAASGKKRYSAGDGLAGEISLRPQRDRPNVWEPVHSLTNDKAGAWLEIDTAKVHEVFFNAASRHVVIRRPLKTHAGATVSLRFKTVDDAAHFIQTVPSDRCRETSVEPLEKRAETLYFKATQRDGVCEELGITSPQAQYKPAPEPVDRSPSVEPVRTRRWSIKDNMLRAHRDEAESDNGDLVAATKKTLSSYSPKPSTNRKTRSVCLDLTPEKKIQRWSEKNPHWKDLWGKSLVFPATGKSRTIVDKDDIPRLDDGEFLNDNLISFYIRYLQTRLEQERPELLKRIYFFSSFFFDKLRPEKGKVNYDGVKSWTAKVDIFSYDYVIVPVNENAHWYLAIICNLPNTLPVRDSGLAHTTGVAEALQDLSVDEDSIVTIGRDNANEDGRADSAEPAKHQSAHPSPPACDVVASSPPSQTSIRLKADGNQPKIITLDSLGSPHSRTCTILRAYLSLEAKNRKGCELEVTPAGSTAKHLPAQENYWDCGVFLLGYLERFLEDPDNVALKLIQRSQMGWDINPSALRVQIRDLIFELQEVQTTRLAEEERARKALKLARSPGSVCTPRKNEPGTLCDEQDMARKKLPQTPVARSPTAIPAHDSLQMVLDVIRSSPDNSLRDSPAVSRSGSDSSSKLILEARNGMQSPKPPKFLEKMVDSSPEDGREKTVDVEAIAAETPKKRARKDEEHATGCSKRRPAPEFSAGNIVHSIEEDDADAIVLTCARYDGIQRHDRTS